jgi:hypothetical protein
MAENREDAVPKVISFDPVWLILRRVRPNLDPPSFFAPGRLVVEGDHATFGPSGATLAWPSARPGNVRLAMDRIVDVRRKHYGWGIVPRFVEVSYEKNGGTAVAYFNDGAWKGWRPLVTGSNRRMVNAIRTHLGIV